MTFTHAQLRKSADQTIIEAQHISQSFVSEKGAELSVLHDISLTLDQGEIVAILGRSGAGKSTFLRILAGLVQPTSGTVRYRGKALHGPNPGVAFVFQTFALMPWLSVQDNVELGLQARGVPRAKRAKMAIEALDSIGLDGFESAYPKELSGGMRQRVGIARSLVLHPDALFMDEPFSALDVLTAENLRQEVLDLWSSKNSGIKSILIVTHNIEEAVQMADRVIVLGSHPGHIIAQTHVSLPRPRDKHSEEFESLVDNLYSILTGRKQVSSVTIAPQSPSGSPSVSGAPNAVSPGASDAEPSPSARTVPAPDAAGRGSDVSANDITASESDSLLIGNVVSSGMSGDDSDMDMPLLPDAMPGGLAGLLEVIAQYPEGVDLADLASDLSFEIDDLFPLVDAGIMLDVISVYDGHAQLTKAGREWQDADILQSKQIFARLALHHAPLVHSITRALEKSKSGKLHGELVVNLLCSKYSRAQAQQQFDIAVGWGRYGELFDYDADDDMLFIS
ncbi:MAG: nitrate/sulfonate/bicarbonate ABC transporter ATP-binding protein [Bifidobacterium sp.]|jgi:NitT/TauT family transport system ATP-binding protein|nr:nitrate/sulfonate/bicarbonate ABC transporter ATP-binding protein [Bifidobacterium sp.]MCI1865237.1 nitrate/sulfonate/bicarbonate ABC transporter ATP-binding protein [Bifidobacterium sp.]